MSLNKISAKEIKDNPIKMISDDWALLTAGTQNKWNTMTVSWGGVGELWGRDVAMVFVRPQRYTFEFMESSDIFTLSFFNGEYKNELGFCGKNSGRDVDKAEQTGLTPMTSDGGVCFEQADTVLICKKIAFQDLEPSGFIAPDIMSNYSKRDYHRMYVGEILSVLKKA